MSFREKRTYNLHVNQQRSVDGKSLNRLSKEAVLFPLLQGHKLPTTALKLLCLRAGDWTRDSQRSLSI